MMVLRSRHAGILAALAIALTAPVARADEPTSEPTSAPAAPAPASSAIPWLAQPSPVATFTAPESRSSGRTLWLVLPALALGGAAIYMRLAKRRGAGPATSRKLEVLDTARVGPKAQVVMVSVGGRQLLLGVTEQSVQRLAWVGVVDAKPELKAVEPVPKEDRPQIAEGPFAHILRSFTQGKPPVIRESDSAALKIAAETKDFVERRTALVEPVQMKALPPADSSDIEEQVSGLRKRRAGKLAGRGE